MNQMTDGMNVNQRDLVLLPFPFADIRTYKKRPAIILSGAEYHNKNKDMICCAVTSQCLIEDKGLPFSPEDMEKGSLRFESVILPCKLLTPGKRFAIRILGRIRKKKAKEIIDFLNLNIKLDD